MKRSRIKANVLKDVDATDDLKAFKNISNDCNDKSENLDELENKFSKNTEQQQSESQSGRQRPVRRVRQKKRISPYIEYTDSDDEEKSDSDEVTEKKLKESQQVNGRKLRARNKPIIARKKPAKSNKELVRRTRNNGSVKRRKNSYQGNISFDDDDDDEHVPEKHEVYVYRQEQMDPSKSASKESEVINQKIDQVTCNIDSTTDCEKNNFVNVDTESFINEKCERNINEITEKKTKNSEDEHKLNNETIEEKYFPQRRNNKGGRRPMTSEEICASAAQPTKIRKKPLNTPPRILSDGTPQQHRARLQNWQKKYCCVVCFARFKGTGGLRNHYKVLHGSGPIYKCDECGKEFPLKERLKLHVRTHTGFKPYKCPECDKTFARGGQLVQHRRTHTHDKPFSCTLCSSSFTCAANLSLHMKRHRGQKDHKCEICGRAFVRRDALKKHLQCLHRDLKNFVCVICNKTFKGHLPQHMRTHARDRPHGCATCGQRFAQKSQLTVHQRTHSGQRPFRCLVCWQAFAHSTALKLHTRRHTGERPFKCNECDAGFTQLPHWKKHMKCIHGRADPYGCKWCPSFFKTKNELDNHERIHPERDRDRDDLNFYGDGDGVSIVGFSNENFPSTSTSTGSQQQTTEKQYITAKYKMMTVEKMRLLLAVLLKRISKKEKLNELGFGKRLIDDVLQDSLMSAGKQPVSENDGLSKLEVLTRNLEILLEWTMPKEHWESFRKMNKTPEDILQALTNAEYGLK